MFMGLIRGLGNNVEKGKVFLIIRWHNHLDPNINKENWSEKEEQILFSKHLKFGNKWSEIAKFLPGRYV